MAEMGFRVSSVNRQNHTIHMIVNGAAVTAVCAPQNNPEVYHQVKSIKNERLYKILQHSRSYHAGSTKGFYDSPQLTHSGFYIHCPKSSSGPKYFKRYSNKRVHRCKELFPKGNAYRRVFDYWWVLY